MALRMPAAALPMALQRIEKGGQVQHIWPVHLSGWQALGWRVAAPAEPEVAVAAEATDGVPPALVAAGLPAAAAAALQAEPEPLEPAAVPIVPEAEPEPVVVAEPEPELALQAESAAEPAIEPMAEPPVVEPVPAATGKGRRGRPRKGSAAPEPTATATPELAASGAERLALPDDLFPDAF